MVGLSKLKEFFLHQISNLFVKAVATLDFKKESNGYQFTNINLLEGETQDIVTHLREYGFYSVPMENAQCFVCFPNGSRDEGFIIKACHSEHEISGEQQEKGMVFMRHYLGHNITMKENSLKIESLNSKPLEIEAEDVNITAKNVSITLQSGGKLTVNNTNFSVDA